MSISHADYIMETLENPGHPWDSGPLIAGQDCGIGRQAACFFDYELTTTKKQTKREKFLSEMKAVMPCGKNSLI
jgi:hypothetical protein